MGCWNGTCGVSHLPIRYGEKVRALVIAENPCLRRRRDPRSSEANGYTYVRDVWVPMTPFIEAKYDDYGGIEDLEPSPVLEAIFQFLRSRLFENDPEDVMAKYDGVLTRDISQEDLLKALRRGRLRLAVNPSYRRDGYLNAGIWMVLEEVYQNLMFMMEPLRVEIEEHYAPFGVVGDFLAGRPPEDIHSPYAEIYGMKTRLSTPEDIRAAAEAGKSCPVVVQEGEPQPEVVKCFVDHAMFELAMERLRIGYQPQCGAGSQDDEILLYGVLADTVKGIVQKRQDELDEVLREEEEELEGLEE